MDFAQLAEFANHGLTWVGFGTIVGLALKTFMPGSDPGGTVATMLMGIAGTLIGCALLRYFYPEKIVEPISMEGFLCGAGGALVLHLFYKALGGYWFDGEQGTRRHRSTRRKRRRFAGYDE